MVATEVKGLDALIQKTVPSSLVTNTRGTSLQPPIYHRAIYRGYTLRSTPTGHAAS
jgi:hypothetical protein